MMLQTLRQRFRHRPDTEHEQALIRVGLAIFALTFLYITYTVTGSLASKRLVFIGAISYLVVASCLVVALLFTDRISARRRVLGIMLDTSIVTFVLVVSDYIGAPLYGGYLWAIIANGFRFGKRYLYIAQGLSVMGFTFVLLVGDFWKAYPMFGIGLLIWLLVIPGYISILLRRLEAARASAEQANAAKSHFLANMSHELRTPLNAIIGYSEMLAEESREQGQTENANDLNKIRHSGIHLLGLINEILDLSKIEEGKMEVLKEDIDIAALVAEVTTTIAPLAEKNDNQLQTEIAADIGILSSDVTKLRQVLFNLLSNACKFTHHGHILLKVDKLVQGDKDYLSFQVIDDGVGVSAERIETIFLPFQQESRSTSKAYGGTGLGLSISKRFCELMGGNLLVESIKGEGSTFTVQLPLQA
jgi:two-component system sensor histidine kinase RpfC